RPGRRRPVPATARAYSTSPAAAPSSGCKRMSQVREPGSSSHTQEMAPHLCQEVAATSRRSELRSRRVSGSPGARSCVARLHYTRPCRANGNRYSPLSRPLPGYLHAWGGVCCRGCGRLFAAIGGSAGGLGSLGHQFRQAAFQPRTAQVDEGHLAVAAHQVRGREDGHVVLLDYLLSILPADIRPGQLPLVEELAEGICVFVAADAQDLEAVLVIVLVQLLQIGQFFHARLAPRGPEVDQHHLALIAGPIDRLTV